jgi:mercuric ion binding protein
MRRSFLAFIALAVLPLAAIAAPAETVTLNVQNMTCATCPITVKKSLQKVPGVGAVSVDYATKTAHVTFDPDKAQPAAFTAATTNAGYPSTVQK